MGRPLANAASRQFMVRKSCVSYCNNGNYIAELFLIDYNDSFSDGYGVRHDIHGSLKQMTIEKI